MGKLTEQQKNIVILGIGTLVFIILAVLSYLDYEEMGVKEQETLAVVTETEGYKQKKVELETVLFPELFRLKTVCQEFKTKLPSKKNYGDIYETLDTIRGETLREFQLKEEELGQWEIDVDDPNADVDDPKTGKKKSPQAPDPQSPPTPGAKDPFTKIVFKIGVDCTFHQLGTILSKIENTERFYAITSLNIPNLRPVLGEAGKPDRKAQKKGRMTFDMVTYAYTAPAGDADLEEQVKASLDPDNPNNVKYKETLAALPVSYQQKNLPKKPEEQVRKDEWDKGVANPFDKDRVLTWIETVETITTGPGDHPTVIRDEGIKEPKVVMTDRELEEQLRLLEDDREILLKFVGDWEKLLEELDKPTKGKKYERRLTDTIASVNQPKSKVDPTILQNAKAQLEAWRKELKDWKDNIDEHASLRIAQNFVKTTEREINELKAAYEKAKEEQDMEALKQQAELLQRRIGELQGFESNSKKYAQLPQGEETKNKLISLEEVSTGLHSDINNQIKLLEKAARVEIQGIIYYVDKKNQKSLSVAYINTQAKYIGDQLEELGFVVHDISEDWVELRLGKDTIKIPMDRTKRLEKFKKEALEETTPIK